MEYEIISVHSISFVRGINIFHDIQRLVRKIGRWIVLPYLFLPILLSSLIAYMHTHTHTTHT